MKLRLNRLHWFAPWAPTLPNPVLLPRPQLHWPIININVDAISQSLKQVNMQFVIGREDYKKAIIALNDALCVKTGN